MSIKEVTSVFDGLRERQQALGTAVRTEVDLICADEPALHRAVVRLLEIDGSAVSPFRLLPFPLLGALTGNPDPALPVCVLSRIWWAGAEALDDLMDGQFDAETAGLAASQVTVASTACITLLPQELIARQRFPAAAETAWTHELTRATMRAAEGQLGDVAGSGKGPTWKNVMVGYAGKSGAAYARDAAMTARLADTETEHLNGWRSFGRLFGVLRQLANDRAAHSAAQDTDLANGTWTLLLAHAAEFLPLAESRKLLDTYARAGHDLDVRQSVWSLLRRPDLANAYDQRMAILHGRLSVLLEKLAAPSRDRDLIQWMINVSADKAKLNVDGGSTLS
ncbi:hypothetical protein ACFVFJ_49590 [Streptomyces sp. NPDC057717]|uniref:hypothetical protein n=1 Tax=Streptomyces sp. NPDC057717 TaxID=3346224 RepID=UPI0036BCBAF7